MNSTGNPGFQWYALNWPFNASPSYVSVAASDYSVSGGVLTMAGNPGDLYNQDMIQTVGYLGPIGTRAVGQALRAGGYFEWTASANYATETESTSWPALWLFDMRGQYMTYGDNTSDAATGEACEIDMLEMLPTGTTGVVTWAGYMHDWTSTTTDNSTPSADATWSVTPDTNTHVFGLLWLTAAQNGGVGQVQWFVDGTQVGVTMNYTSTGGSSPAAVPSNPNGTFYICDSGFFNFQASTGYTIPLTISKAQVWQ